MTEFKTILCYGDSNTWGYDPLTRSRFPFSQRWTSVLGASLGSGFIVAAEGLCGRTTVLDDPWEGENKNGRRFFLTCVETHRPLDFIIIMLGTNDLKKKFASDARGAALGVRCLLEDLQKSGMFVAPADHIIAVIPPRIENLSGTDFEKLFEGAEKKSEQLAESYREILAPLGCTLIDSRGFLKASPADAVHLDAAAHRVLGEKTAETVTGIQSAE